MSAPGGGLGGGGACDVMTIISVSSGEASVDLPDVDAFVTSGGGSCLCLYK